MRIVYGIPEVAVQGFPAEEIDQFTEVVDECTGSKKGKQYE